MRLLFFLLLNFGALALGGFLMGEGPSSAWYSNLNKAPWTPPGWVFGASWTVISDIEDGKSTSINEARERALKVIETMGPGGDNCNLFTNSLE